MTRLPDTNRLIQYEDEHIIVCIKPHGIATQGKSLRTPDMVTMLKTHLSQITPKKQPPYLAVVHRLDQPVTGILVFAKTPTAAKELSRQIQAHEFGKYYRALLENTPPQNTDILENYMIKDAKSNTSQICSKNTPGAKLARLEYKIIKKGRGIFKNSPSPNEVEVSLFTGRHHQIRVQFAHIGCPIVGDTKYNLSASAASGSWRQICLCAYRLSFFHPVTKERMEFVLDHFPGPDL